MIMIAFFNLKILKDLFSQIKIVVSYPNDKNIYTIKRGIIGSKFWFSIHLTIYYLFIHEKD